MVVDSSFENYHTIIVTVVILLLFLFKEPSVRFSVYLLGKTTRRVLVEWNAFYAAMAGSSATVIGLIFVAVQLKSDKFSQKPVWRAVASSTFFIYFMVFFLSLTFLIPAIGPNTKSLIILVHVGLGAYRVVRIWFPV